MEDWAPFFTAFSWAEKGDCIVWTGIGAVRATETGREKVPVIHNGSWRSKPFHFLLWNILILFLLLLKMTCKVSQFKPEELSSGDGFGHDDWSDGMEVESTFLILVS